jgi:hypothetical protein
MRILACSVCKTVEELPDYELHDENEVDPYVSEVLLKHVSKDAMAHGGEQLQFAPFRLAHVEDRDWIRSRDEVLKRFAAENKKVGFEAWAYEAINTFEEDAMRCYNEHHRPSEGRPCIDFWDDSKRIGRPTREGQIFVREYFKVGQRDPHLCQFCPYYSVVQTEKRWKAGLYRN